MPTKTCLKSLFFLKFPDFALNKALKKLCLYLKSSPTTSFLAVVDIS